jgi:hypothetical protein
MTSLRDAWDTEAKPPVPVVQTPPPPFVPYTPQPQQYMQYPQHFMENGVVQTAMSETRVEEDEKEKKVRQQQEMRLLSNINDMFAVSEDFLVHKISDLHKVTLHQTKKNIKDSVEKAIPFDWTGVITIGLIVVGFMTFMVMQQCNFKKLMSAMKKTQRQSIEFKELYSDLLPRVHVRGGDLNPKL